MPIVSVHARSTALVIALLLASCRDGAAPQASAGALPAPAMPTSTRLAPYPRASWRLVRPERLEQVVLFFAHILVRHGEKTTRRAPFGPPGWEPLDPAPARTRLEALERARSVLALLRRHPSRFAHYAAEYSDDIVTRNSGGYVGGLNAFALSEWPDILDAIAAHRTGQLSEVVETEFGFHILERLPVPSGREVAGQRLVIGYEKAPWLERVGGRQRPRRTRAEALALALEAARRAKKGESFDRLVKDHSESEDAEVAGDFGVWSPRESSPYPLEIHLLTARGEGEVVGPIDTRAGFVVCKRVAAEQRTVLAMEAIRVAFEPRTREKALELARSIARAVQDDPGLFAGYLGEYCCTGVESWTRGRRSHRLTELLERLEPGQVAGEPLELEQSFLLPRRVAAGAASQSPRQVFELPSAPDPDLDYLVRHAGSRALVRRTTELRDRGSAALDLRGHERDEFFRVHADLVHAFEASSEPDDRSAAMAAAAVRLEELLGKPRYRKYTELVNRRVAGILLDDR